MLEYSKLDESQWCEF